jgi:type 1 glutamine amidotransferase
MAKILIYGGGPYHPFQAQGQWFKTVLTPLGHDVAYSEERCVFAPDYLEQFDLLILTALDFGEAHNQPLEWWESPANRKGEYTPLSDEHMQSIENHIAKGKPLFCHHCAIANWDERDEFLEIFDGRWVWGQTTHTLVGMQVPVSLAESNHELLDGLTNFSLTDELYYKLEEPKRCEVLMYGTDSEGEKWPLAWAGTTGKDARYLYSGLGHDMASFQSPQLQRFLVNSVNWLLK